MEVLYTVVYTLGFVLLSPVFLYKMWKRGKYRANFLQRFGRYAPALRARLAGKPHPRCWIQAVSVGEVNIALVFIRALQQRFPRLQVVLSTTTSTGYALAAERLPATVTLLYFPQDFPPCVRRAYDLVQPDFIVLMESELWPNFIWTGARRRVPLFLVNARMSPRSVRRHRQFAWLSRRVLARLPLVCAQSREDADHFRAFGAPRVELTGNIKYDASLPHAGQRTFDPARLLRELGVEPSRSVLVAGSTHPGEEEILFDLLPAVPGLFLVLVPRHVERAPEIVEIARRKNVRFTLRRDGVPATGVDCLLVNTTGELRAFYEVATVIFVGKSLTGHGGQNIVEAAASGRPVVFGPHMENFKAIAAEFVAAGAGVQVPDAAGLRRIVEVLLRDAGRRQAIAAAAQRVIEANVGATQRTVELIGDALRGVISS
jgi:3-deoxy-D-manno-octulosonic-acid transferase